jgi:rod shape-determining protein MreD
MKPRVYLMILLLVVPLQAAFFNPLALGGIKPDFPLVLIYLIGLLTGPTEACVAGMAVGLVLDIGSAGIVGMNGFTRGMIGLGAGFLGRRVLDIGSPSNTLFLAAFSLMEGIVISLLMQIFYGAVPFFSLFFTRMLPEAVYTGILGTFVLRFISRRNVRHALMRRSFQKE